MNNAELKQMIAEFGNQIVCIVTDNNRLIFLNYDKYPYRLEDIQYKTFGETDMFSFVRYEKWDDPNRANYGTRVPIREWHLTECIQDVVTTDDPSFAPDPLKLK